MLLLIPAIKFIIHGFDFALWKRVLRYSLPLLVAGLAGIANETLDRVLIKWILWPLEGEQYTLSQLGIYGANYKMAVILSLFLAALRYAAEPFYFNQEKNQSSRQIYADVMKWVVIALCFIAITVVLNIEFFKYFIGREEDGYWEGLKIVPIILFAYIAFGIYQNNSIWFKLNEKTYYGMIFTLVGAFVTVVLNIILIPIIGYKGSAWATLACYTVMCLVSIVVGQKQFYIPYDFKRIFTYLLIAFVIILLSFNLDYFDKMGTTVYIIINLVVMLSFVLLTSRLEKIGIKELRSFLPSIKK